MDKNWSICCQRFNGCCDNCKSQPSTNLRRTRLINIDILQFKSVMDRIERDWNDIDDIDCWGRRMATTNWHRSMRDPGADCAIGHVEQTGARACAVRSVRRLHAINLASTICALYWVRRPCQMSHLQLINHAYFVFYGCKREKRVSYILGDWTFFIALEIS